jgi:type III secretory pathway component EscR
MLETPPPNNPRSTTQVILGFLLGVVLSLACLFFSILLGNALGVRQTWMYPALTGVALVASGIVAARMYRESSYALGVLIAVSLGFLLNAICGVALSSS